MGLSLSILPWNLAPPRDSSFIDTLEGSAGESLALVLVVPEQELSRFGEASVLDLLDSAAELEESVLRSRAA